MGRIIYKVILMLCVTIAIVSAILVGKSVYRLDTEQEQFEQIKFFVKKEKQTTEEDVTETNQKKKEEESTENKENDEETLLHYQELKRENPDFVGWICIDGTNIDYPVMQNLEDAEYYLYRDFWGNKSYTGVPFLRSYETGMDSNIDFIYGHHMKNGTMFGDLLNYQKEDYWKAHPTIQYDSLQERRKYQIWAAFYANDLDWGENGLLYPFIQNGCDYNEEDYLKIMKKRLYETEVTPTAEDSLLFLITCSYHEKNGRFIVAGVIK